MLFTLIGMPGCGKSCMGRAISRKLKIPLIDVDKRIELSVGMKLQSIIEGYGVDRFRAIEEETLLSLYSGPSHAIVSTGGSAVYSQKGMEHFRSLGKIIYLYCGYDTLLSRLGDFSSRGIVFKEGQSFRGLFDERTPLYEKYADIIVNCDGNSFPKYHAAVMKVISELM